MKNQKSRWPLFFWKMYFFSLNLSSYKDNKEVIPRHTMDSYCVPWIGPGTRLEPKAWALGQRGKDFREMSELSLRRCSEASSLGVEMIGEGVRAPGLGGQRDMSVLTEQERRRGSLFRMQGVTSTPAAEGQECMSWRQPAWD